MMRLAIAIAVASLLAPLQSFAQNHPNKAITIAVPFPPGGATDILATRGS